MASLAPPVTATALPPVSCNETKGLVTGTVQILYLEVKNNNEGGSGGSGGGKGGIAVCVEEDAMIEEDTTNFKEKVRGRAVLDLCIICVRYNITCNHVRLWCWGPNRKWRCGPLLRPSIPSVILKLYPHLLQPSELYPRAQSFSLVFLFLIGMIGPYLKISRSVDWKIDYFYYTPHTFI